MTQGCYVRVHVGPDGQLLLMVEFICLKLAHLLVQFGDHVAIREKWEAVLCCLLSAPPKYNNAWLLTIMANVVASCAGSDW